ncbi:MAG: hypothetical protein HQ518_11230 [Rhodopirellula sp.]|nr:hypothetical protein [Rhodopirellula sp.]
MASNNWSRVSRTNPCPICDGPDNCTVSTDGCAVWCGRVPEGSLKQNGGGQWLHVRTDGYRTHDYEHPSHQKRRKPARQARKSAHKTDWQWLIEHGNSLPEIRDRRSELAQQLGVSVKPLARLQVGWSPRKQCWLFPERDGCGNIIGISKRFRNGRKRQVTGGNRGLCYAPDWEADSGPVLLVEGATDTAALLSIGLCAIGRPSNSGGVALLCELLCRLPFDREVIVVGENDRKPHHDLNPSIQSRHSPECEGCLKCWPGYAAFSVAKKLAEALLRPVGVAFPPDDAKDVRDLLHTLEGVS